MAESTLTLYASEESLYCAKLRILLRHKNIDWREIEPEGGCASAAYRALIPAGTMPALIDGDTVIADSEAIAEYLEERTPQPPMLPRDRSARAKCRERSRFHDTRLEPELRKLFTQVAPALRNAAVIGVQAEMLALRLRELSRLLAADQTLALDGLTLGDCGFPVCFAWIDRFAALFRFELDWPHNLLTYRAAIEAQPAVAAELAAYSTAMMAWIESKHG